MRTLLLCLLAAIVGCQSQNTSEVSVQDSLRQELNAIAEQNQELQRVNDSLRTAELLKGIKQRERETAVYPVESILGGWKVRMRCTESDCPNNTQAGDILHQVWNVDLVGGEHIITVMNAPQNTNSEYHGKFNGKDLLAYFSREGSDWGGGRAARVSLSLRMQSEDSLVGTRRVVNSQPCSIIYNVVAIRD